MLNLFLYGYLPFVVLSLLSAVYYWKFAGDPKAGLGVVMALAFAFIPIANIYWVMIGIAQILRIPDIKHPWYKKFEQGMFGFLLYFWSYVILTIEWVITKWQRLNAKFIN